MCIKGTKGDEGLKGDQGHHLLKGTKGDSDPGGDQGHQGIKGDQGFQGAKYVYLLQFSNIC